MKKKKWNPIPLVFFILLSIQFFSGNRLCAAGEKNDGEYVITGVKVYSKSNSTTEAKDLAIKDGERRALRELFSKINVNPNYTKYINDNILADMVSSIRIAEEIMAKNTYSGILTVIFDREFVKYNLGNMGIMAKKSHDDVFLYIPLFIQDGSSEPNPLDSSNAWYRAAYNKFFEREFENIFIIDNYSLSNSGFLTNKHIKKLNYTSFETLLSKYASNTVLISIAKYNRENDRVDVTLREITAETNEEKFLNFVNKDTLPRDALIEQASVQLLESIEKRIRQDKKTIVATTSEAKNSEQVGNYIDVFIVIPDLEEFVFIKNILKNFDFLERVETLDMTIKIARLRLYFNCYEDELTQLFREKKLTLSYRDSQYFIRYNPDQ
ncbi:MAG: hypothetical protein LBI70_00790 [Rickettsiales bacterium]|jgi:hypothetical protein|nr:hypothetical protein [Rickettsiales bacterium]